jgi:hypothetical protein
MYPSTITVNSSYISTPKSAAKYPNMTGESPPKNRVHLDSNELCFLDPGDAKTDATKGTPKESVESGVNDKVVSKALVSDMNDQHPASAHATNSPVDTLASPVAIPTSPVPNLSNNSTPSPTSNHPTPPTSSQTDKQTCAQRVVHSDPPVKSFFMDPDPGEKDADGHVKQAINEPCEACGGQVIWATRGEYYLICAKCQEPQ